MQIGAGSHRVLLLSKLQSKGGFNNNPLNPVVMLFKSALKILMVKTNVTLIRPKQINKAREEDDAIMLETSEEVTQPGKTNIGDLCEFVVMNLYNCATVIPTSTLCLSDRPLCAIMLISLAIRLWSSELRCHMLKLGYIWVCTM